MTTNPGAGTYPAHTGQPTAEEYLRIQGSAEFSQLRRNFRAFSIPMAIAFMVWYFGYVLASAFATDVMSTPVIGSLNLGLLWGLLQFATTFLITWLYIRRAYRKLDPISTKLRDELEGGITT